MLSPASIISQDLPQSGPLPHGEKTNLYCPYAFHREWIGKVCFRCEGMICDDEVDDDDDVDLSCVLVSSPTLLLVLLLRALVLLSPLALALITASG